MSFLPPPGTIQTTPRTPCPSLPAPHTHILKRYIQTVFVYRGQCSKRILSTVIGQGWRLEFQNLSRTHILMLVPFRVVVQTGHILIHICNRIQCESGLVFRAAFLTRFGITKHDIRSQRIRFVGEDDWLVDAFGA